MTEPVHSLPSWRRADDPTQASSPRAIEDPPPDHLLFSASCPSAKVCVAVGYDGHGNFQGTFVETMNNNSWTVHPKP